MAEGTTTIGASITITGELRSEEGVAIHGKVKGNIQTTADILVEEGGDVEANVVTTSSIEVRGRVEGNIEARRFEIHPGGNVIGDIRAPSVVLSDGAKYKGHIDMDVALPAAEEDTDELDA